MARKSKAVPSMHGLGGLWKDGAEIPRLSKVGVVSHLALQAWRSFLHSPITSVLTFVTITTALLVFAMFVLIIENVKVIVSAAQNELSVSLYLQESGTPDQIAKLREEISKNPDIERVALRSKDQALAEFREALADKAAILEGLESENPLPASLEVKFKDVPDVADRIQVFADDITKRELVEHVDYSRGLITRLSGFLRFFSWAGFFSIVFMLLITSFIITNTIKLALYSHREEIEIMKLVGATDSFIRAPYMIEGFVQGLIGAVISILLAYSCFVLVQDIITKNEILRMFLHTLQFLSVHSILLVVICGVSVGILGSYLAVKKFLAG